MTVWLVYARQRHERAVCYGYFAVCVRSLRCRTGGATQRRAVLLVSLQASELPRGATQRVTENNE
jgi:hypothetical protein